MGDDYEFTGHGERADLTDDQIEAMINNPATIPDHETALEIMDILDGEIAGIQAQIDAKAAQYNGRPMTTGDDDWLRRASYAAAIRMGLRRRVYMRDKEIRGAKRVDAALPPEAKADKIKANLIKQERLKIEAETRRDAKKLALENARIERARLELKIQETKKRMVPHHSIDLAPAALPEDAKEEERR